MNPTPSDSGDFARVRFDPFVLLAAFLGLFLFLPLANSGLPAAPDAMLHFYRTALWRWAWEDGVAWPRWHTLLYQGYGYPVLSFSGPLFYVIAAAASIPVANILTGYKIAVMLSCLACALGMYFWARDLIGRSAAIVATAAYTFATIRFRELYFVGGYGQFMAWSLYPWVLFFWLRLARGYARGYFAGAVLMLTAVLLTHNISAMLFMLPFALYVSVLVLTHRRQRTWRIMAVAAIASLLIAAVFWLPAIAEMRFTRAHVLTEGYWDVKEHFVRLANLFERSMPLDTRAVNPPLPFNFGRLHLLLAGLGLFTVLLRWQRPHYRIHLVLAGSIAGLATFMMLPESLPVWRVVPFISFAEYPWRWFGVAFLFTSLLAGASVNWLAPWPKVRLLAAGVLVTALVGVTAVYQVPKPFVSASATREDFVRYEGAYRAVGTTAGNEFLTPWTVDLPATPALSPDLARLALVTAPPGVTARVLEEKPIRLRYAISAAEPASITLAQFYFPGWRASLDGRSIPLRPAPGTGLIALDVPAGDHELVLGFRDTPVRTAATAIALAGLVLLSLATVRRWPAAQSVSEESPIASEPVRLPMELLISVSVVFVVGLGMLWIGPRMGWFRVTSPPGRATPAEQAHGAVDLPVAEQARLIGYDIDRSLVRPGGELRVRLYWQATDRMDEDYASFVQLVAGPERRMFAQSDRQHPGNIPTSTWTNRQYVVDEHFVDVPSETPAIALEIVAGLYAPASGERLGTVTLPTYIHIMPSSALDIKGVDDSSATVFGDQIELLGHKASRQGDTLVITLYWKALKSPTTDYQVFLHLMGGSAQKVGQVDGSPLTGLYPTSRWLRSQMIEDTYSLPYSSREHPKQVLVGLYDLSTMQRLSAHARDGEPRPDNAVGIVVPGS